MRLDPYRLKPVPIETPSGHLKTSSVWKLTWRGVHVDHCGSIPNSWICPTEACDEFYIIICIFTRINCKSSRNQLLRTKRCVSVFAKRWCTCTLTSNSPHLTAANFLWGYLKAQVFTHTLPHINSLKNAIRQEIAKVTQDTLRRVMASVPGRWQQCLDCHGGHLQDVVLKTWGFFCESKTLTHLTVFSCIYCCVQ